VVYKNNLYFGKCCYYGPHIGNYEWELVPVKNFLETWSGDVFNVLEKTCEPPQITAWREIPPPPEIPVKYKIRAGSEHN
jgi:hypothetical protein